MPELLNLDNLDNDNVKNTHEVVNTSSSKDKITPVFENLRQYHMYFQTQIRNVALTTAVSCAILGYSRYYRNKNFYKYNIILILAAVLVIFISAYLNFLLLLNTNKDRTRPGFEYLNKYLVINYIFVVVHLLLFGLGITTMIRNM